MELPLVFMLLSDLQDYHLLSPTQQRCGHPHENRPDTCEQALQMVLISITSDPNDFLSAPPPGVSSSNRSFGRYRNLNKPVLFPKVKSILLDSDPINFDLNPQNPESDKHLILKNTKPRKLEVSKSLSVDVIEEAARENDEHPKIDPYSSDCDFCERRSLENVYAGFEKKLSSIYSSVELDEKEDLTKKENFDQHEHTEEKRNSSGKSWKEQEELSVYDRQELFKDIPVLPGKKNEGMTILMSACHQELEHEVKDILRRKPKIVTVKDTTGKTALHYCAENQNTSCIEQILELAPNMLDQGDNEGYTLLHMAVISGNTTMIKFLQGKGADKDAIDLEHHTAIHWAIVCGQLEALDVLCNSGASMNTPDVHGAYPIHYAAQLCGPSSESINANTRTGLVGLRKLLARGVNPNVSDLDSENTSESLKSLYT